MLKLLLITLFTLSVAHSQITIQIRDKQTKNPVAYANIWKENSLYKTADSTGVFVVDEKDSNNHFKITCVGYQDTLVKLEKEIFMQPNKIELAEVKVVKRKFEKVKKLGKVNRGDNQYGVQWDSKMAMTAKYFPNLNTSNSYLSKVRFFATASTKNRLISVLVYSVDENGSPGEILNSESIMCRLKKGRHKVEVNLNQYNIEFPSNGIFIVLQHPLLEQNKYYDPKSTHPNAFFYEPSIAIDFMDTYVDSWYFDKGIWNRNQKYSIMMELQFSD
jgi:hypothetical protein